MSKFIEKVKSPFKKKEPKVYSKKEIENRFYNKKWFKRTLAVVIILAIVFGIVKYNNIKKQKKAESESKVTFAQVKRGDLETVLSASGTVYPIEQYDIVPLVNGTITSCPFEEGDEVHEGDVLYTFESVSLENNLTKSERNLSSTRDKVEKLTINAPASGRVDGLNLMVGDNASGKICTITDTSKMLLTLNYPAAEAGNISVGDSATVSISQYMVQKNGTVTRKSTASTSGSGGVASYKVVIEISDPQNISEGTQATATIYTPYGDYESVSSASLKYPDPVTVNVNQSGEVSNLYVHDGDWINKGQTIVKLTNSALEDSYSDAKLNVSDAREKLDDTKVTSPINGKVLEKNYKTGDTVNNGQSSTTLMVVADMSKMYFTMYVDELDVASVALGQKVDITAEALPGEQFEGSITKVSVIGTSTNGVTTYPIEVTIDEPGNLLPTMNVDAKVIIKSSKNTLYVPVDAVSFYDGEYTVEVSSTKIDMSNGNFSMDSEGRERSKEDFKKGSKNNQMMEVDTKNTTKVKVTVGITTDDYIEITSGLEEGQFVVYTPSGTGGQSSIMKMMMQGGHPGSMGGGSMGGGSMGGNQRGGSMGGGSMGGNQRGGSMGGGSR